MEGLKSPFEAVAQGLKDLWDLFKDKLGAVINGISNIYNKLSNGFQSVIDKIGDTIGNVIDKLGDILEFIGGLPKKLYDKVVYLFVPSENPFSKMGNDIKAFVSEKFAFVEQIKTLFNSLLNNFGSGNSEKPVFNVTIMGQTFNLFDFQAFDIVRYVVQGIILAICYAKYFQKMIRRIPPLINNMPE